MADSGATGLLGALPEGWVMLGRCRTGTAGPVGYPTGCWALAHPTMGIALVDVAPDATPNAEARVRRALGAANFWPAFPGTLPVWHGRIELSAWRALPGIMAEGFSELPALTVPGKAAWIAAARTALADDPAWDVPGATPRGPRPMPMLGPPDDEIEDEMPEIARRPLRGRLGLVLGFAATFAVGLASGVLLFAGEAPAPPPGGLAALAPPQMPATTPPTAPAAGEIAPTATSAPTASSALAAPAPARDPPPMRDAVAVGAVDTPPPPRPPEQIQAALAAPAPEPVQDKPSPPPAVADASGSGADAGEPLQMASSSLPLPPLAPKAPVQKVAKPPDRIDRACTQAVFRFQQGLALTPAEQAHVRNGCATRR